MGWLTEFSQIAQNTDQFIDHPNHVELLAAGLMSEAGGILAELKKKARERDAYPTYRLRMEEELGDFLWYFVRLADIIDTNLISKLESRISDVQDTLPNDSGERALIHCLEFGSAVGIILEIAKKGLKDPQAQPRLETIWNALVAVSHRVTIPLDKAAAHNIKKIESRWPRKKKYIPFFDEAFPKDQQLPRILKLEFQEYSENDEKIGLLKCNGVNFGDRLTDNIDSPDGYRFHDIFHFSYATHLGWSPVVRALLRCKRKSNPQFDQNQDGARAGILEEAISAMVFSRAKGMKYFEGKERVDFELLKSIQELTRGYEVENVPLWQWENAIINGYSIFRQLKNSRGGIVIMDLIKHKLQYISRDSRMRFIHPYNLEIIRQIL